MLGKWQHFPSNWVRRIHSTQFIKLTCVIKVCESEKFTWELHVFRIHVNLIDRVKRIFLQLNLKKKKKKSLQKLPPPDQIIESYFLQLSNKRVPFPIEQPQFCSMKKMIGPKKAIFLDTSLALVWWGNEQARLMSQDAPNWNGYRISLTGLCYLLAIPENNPPPSHLSLFFFFFYFFLFFIYLLTHS